MNNHLIIFGIAVLLLAVGLSGCSETQNENTISDKVSVDYSFIKGSTEDYVSSHYVRGTVKNIAGYKLSKIKITANFYDENDIYLKSYSDYVYNLPDTYTEDFEIGFPVYGSYHENVDHATVKVEVTD